MDLDSIWNEFIEKLRKQLYTPAFDLWFKNTKLLSLENDTATVQVKNIISKKQLKQDSWNTLIENTFSEITGSNFKFEYVTEEELSKNIVIDTDEIGVPSDEIIESNLNPKYTFENFIAGGKNNSFTKSAALAVAERPGLMYNPLYIYGSSGLGKTHLMHAIGNYITTNSNKKVLYVSSEKFINDFMQIYKKKKDNDGLFNNDIEEFKRKYRNLDVLIIDDIQYLETATGVQQEFFNTFNELHDNNKQIILASDRSPDDLKKLEDRVRTRFNWGIRVNIDPPDFNVRMEIIDKKIENNQIDVIFPQEVKEYIASNCTSDVRKLESAIMRVFAYATITNAGEITYELAVEALNDYFSKNIIAKNKIELLQKIIADMYNITIEDLKGKKRKKEITVPRQIAMYIAKEHINESFPKIGSEFGGKDHTTVMYSVNKLKDELKTNKKLQEEINKIIERLNVEKR